MASWLGIRVTFRLSDGRELAGTVKLTLGERLHIMTDACEHRGCQDHPARWYARAVTDVTVIDG